MDKRITDALAPDDRWTPDQLRKIRSFALADLRRRVVFGIALVTFPIWYLPLVVVAGFIELGSWPSIFDGLLGGMERRHTTSMLRLAIDPSRLKPLPKVKMGADVMHPDP